jgi:hypothetical protein
MVYCGFARYLFHIASIWVREFFGSSSGVLPEIRLFSRRTPEGISKEYGRNTDNPAKECRMDDIEISAECVENLEERMQNRFKTNNHKR